MWFFRIPSAGSKFSSRRFDCMTYEEKDIFVLKRINSFDVFMKSAKIILAVHVAPPTTPGAAHLMRPDPGRGLHVRMPSSQQPIRKSNEKHCSHFQERQKP